MTTPLSISPVSAKSPDMSDAEFARLVESIRENGQLVPIWVSGDEIIDGRKRFAACQRLGIEPKVVNLDPSQDAEQVSLALNILRTHYTPSQRAMFAAGRATATRSDASKRRGIFQTKNSLEERPASIGEAAAEAGINRSSVIVAKRIARAAAPEVVDAVKAGKLTLHAAEQITKRVPAEAQAEAVATVLANEYNKGKRASRIVDGRGEEMAA